MRALAYLRLQLLKNGVLSTITNPKRLVFAVFFVAWIAAVVFFNVVLRLRQGRVELPMPGFPADSMQLAAVAVLILLTVAAIERAFEGAIFTFAPADFDFLFPTPLSRRQIMASRLALDVGSTLLTIGVFVIFAFGCLPAGLLPIDTTLRGLLVIWLAGGLYTVFVVNFARIIELLVAGGQSVLNIAQGVTRVVLWVIAVGFLAAVACAVTSGAISPERLLAAISHPPLSILLLPILSLAALVTGQTLPLYDSLPATLVMLATLAAACSTVVCLLDRDVVEATIEHSMRVSRMKSAARTQNVERMMGEALRGRKPRDKSLVVNWRSPSLALAYKALAEASHATPIRWLGWLLVIAAPAPIARFLPTSDQHLPILLGPVMAYVLLLTSSFHSLRMRSEIAHVSLLRTLPLPPWRQLLGMVLPRALLQSAGLMLAVIALWVGRPSVDPTNYIGIILSLPPAVTAVFLLSATAACLFPDGADPIQRFLGGLVLTFGMGLVLAPCAILVAAGIVFELPGILIGALGNAGLLPVLVVVMIVANRAYTRFQPGED